MMRKLKKIKITFSEKKGTTYALEWGESENGTTWERHALASYGTEQHTGGTVEMWSDRGEDSTHDLFHIVVTDWHWEEKV